MRLIKTDIDAISRIDVVPTILEVICRTTGMGFAAIARVTDDRWVACAIRDEIAFGLSVGGELKVETTICHEIRQKQEAVVIDHVTEDKDFCTHPTPAMYGFQSYISVPIIRKDGSFFGTLCSIDPKPARLKTPEVIGMFKLYADLISFHLNAVDQLDLSESYLQEERKTAELRDQFIAILGHDLRNPVGAISSSAQVLQRLPLDGRTMRFVNIIQDASFRMKGLIDNILDFARGRLGDGIMLNCNTDEPLDEILSQVITELSIIWPNRIINKQLNLTQPVNCDGRRIAQLFSNLLSNALTHGKKNTPVNVHAYIDEKDFVLTVTNEGEQIPAAAMARLFHPFSRGEVKPNQQGLGLGLYISSEIARAHGGSLTVASTSKETRFTLRLPA